MISGSTILILIGILFIALGCSEKKKERRQDDFNDWCYDNIQRSRKRNKRRGPRNR